MTTVMYQEWSATHDDICTEEVVEEVNQFVWARDPDEYPVYCVDATIHGDHGIRRLYDAVDLTVYPDDEKDYAGEPISRCWYCGRTIWEFADIAFNLQPAHTMCLPICDKGRADGRVVRALFAGKIERLPFFPF